MPSSLDNPFRKPPRSKKEAEEISNLLVGKREKDSNDTSAIELSSDEQAIAEKAEVATWTRKQMEEWAKKFKLRDGWIDKNLEQNDDGTWTADFLELYFVSDPEDFPKGIIKVKHSLYLNSLTSAEGLTLPETIGGSLGLILRSPEGLTLPKSIGRSLILNSLTSAEGLIFPESIGEDLNLENLTSAKGLTLPKSIGRSLILNSLTSAEGLTLPETIGGSLRLSKLRSPEGLTLPETIGGSLYLNALISAKHLVLPQRFTGTVYFKALPESEKEELRKKYPNAKIV